VSPLYGVFSPVDQSTGAILDAFFESSTNTRNYLAPLVQKGAKNTIAITNKRFLRGRIHVPSDASERAALADLVATAKLEINVLHRTIEAIMLQKRGMMQRLFTGTRRVSAREGNTELTAALTCEETV
jgi:type I restriction enzyme, S subunit